MFYDVYKKLCDENGEKPYQLPLKLGAKSNSMVAQWKKGSLPRSEMLQKIAEYFKVTVGFLMDGETDEKNPASVSADGKLYPAGYDRLTPENRKIVDRLIADLANNQSVD